MALRHVLFSSAFLTGLALSACNSQSEGTTLAQACANGVCPIGYECFQDYCLPLGADTDDGPDTTDSLSTTVGDGDGDPDTGDGDGEPATGDGDGDGDTNGDGDGDTSSDTDCQPGTLGCTCDGGVCALGLFCDGDYVCSQPVCGDDLVTNEEDCDGDDLQGFDCQDLGYDWGDLACSPSCSYDTSACGDGPVCGNGIIEVGEQCDSNNLQGLDCQALGFGGGTLGCDPVICTFDASNCTN